MGTNSEVTLHTGRKMPVIGLGTWQLTVDTAVAVANALQAGYRMIDTSGDYGTQPGVGEGIRRNGIERSAIYVVTKIEETDDAYEATIQNLNELGLDYVDLMLIHRPPASGAGEELWGGLIKAKAEGLTRDIGVSNYSAEQMNALIDALGEVPVVNQIEWSPFGHSEKMFHYAKDNSIIIQAYSPLTRTKRLADERLQGIAGEYGKTPAQVLLRWNLQRGTVPLPKAHQPQHQRENIDIFDFEISARDMKVLDGLNERYSSLGALPYE
ncbi:aldo/keto reductase [Chelativorans alearense]|uniref:aldo/keto reductase n=1 Tax=Chelativorans alearense TaxID=2681495 RepID=UPI0013D5F710|nr:aldo/keto reductase [Chelativorans alearense]